MSSRAIARFGARTPHFTTIARFVSTLGPDIVAVFAAVLTSCDKQGLIGRELLAISGVNLPDSRPQLCRWSGFRGAGQAQSRR